MGIWLAIVAGFLISELGGFSVGRYLVIVPLALTAYGVSRNQRTMYKAASMAAAFGLWVLFSFVLFGVVLLETGFLIEFVICLAALAVTEFLRRSQERSKTG